MDQLRSFVTLGIMAGIGLAILTNADKSVKIINSVAGNFFNLIKTASGEG
jgi:hypothetical protein